MTSPCQHNPVHHVAGVCPVIGCKASCDGKFLSVAGKRGCCYFEEVMYRRDKARQWRQHRHSIHGHWAIFYTWVLVPSNITSKIVCDCEPSAESEPGPE